VTPTIFGSTVGYPSDSLASCSTSGHTSVLTFVSFFILNIFYDFLVRDFCMMRVFML